MKTVTKTDIADHIKNSFGFSKNFANSLVSSIFEELTNIIVSDSKINIPKLGTFEVYQKNARPGMNINKGEKMIIKPRKIVRFIPSRTAKERVNNGG